MTENGNSEHNECQQGPDALHKGDLSLASGCYGNIALLTSMAAGVNLHQQSHKRQMHSRRVLVVDDEPEQLRAFSRMLAASGYQPILATCAQEALAHAKTAGATVALIDISMPKLDGIELFNLFRGNTATAHIPVVLMTDIVAPESLLAAASRGLQGVAIFRKDYSLENITSVISEATQYANPTCHLLRRDWLVADPEHHRAWISGKEISHLPTRRHELLCELMRSKLPVSRSQLLTAIWTGCDNPNIVDVNILRLRQDLREYTEISIATKPDGYQLVLLPPAASHLRPYTL